MSTEPAARDRTLLIWVEPLLLHEAVTQLLDGTIRSVAVMASALPMVS